MDRFDIEITNSNLGRICVPFTAQLSVVVGEDMTFTALLLATEQEVMFPGGETATIVVSQSKTQ